MLRLTSRLPPFIAIVISSLLGSVQGGAQSATAETPRSIILPASTSVILRLKEQLYKKDAQPGYSLKFEVHYDVVLNGQVVIQSGTPVNGSVRGVVRGAEGQANVLVDLGTVQTVSGETVRLVPLPFSGNQPGGIGEAVSWGSETGPLLPAFVIASLFEKKVLLDKDWDGVVQTVGDVALDPEKQQAAQEQYTANRKAAQAQLCELLASQNSPNMEGISPLARRSVLGDANKASLLHKAGDWDGAIGEYLQLLPAKQDLPCSDKYFVISFGGLFSGAVAVPKEQERLLNSTNADLHLQLAGLYREKRGFVDAISEFRTAVQLEPEDEGTRISLINTLKDSGNLDAALAESNEAIRRWPDSAYFHYLLGSVLVKKNDADAAIVELQWALTKAKNRLSPANCELGRAFEQKNELEAAFRQYHTAFRAHVRDEQCLAAYQRLKLQLKK